MRDRAPESMFWILDGALLRIMVIAEAKYNNEYVALLSHVNCMWATRRWWRIMRVSHYARESGWLG